LPAEKKTKQNRHGDPAGISRVNPNLSVGLTRVSIRLTYKNRVTRQSKTIPDDRLTATLVGLLQLVLPAEQDKKEGVG